MKKLNIEVKKTTYGGITPSLLWVGLMGGALLVNGISNIVSSMTAPNGANQTKTKSGYIRAGMTPMRSAVMLPL